MDFEEMEITMTTSRTQTRSDSYSTAQHSRSGSHSTAQRSRSGSHASGQYGRSSTYQGSGSRRSSSSRGTGPRGRRRRRRRRRILAILSIALMTLLIAAAIITAVYFMRRVRSSYTVEAGSEFSAADLLRYAKDQERYGSLDTGVDTSVPGEYKVTIPLSPFKGHSTVTVADTQKPIAIVQDVNAWYGSQVSASDFVVQLQDATAVTVTFNGPQPDTYTIGTQAVTLLFTDAGGNFSAESATLTVSGAKNSVEIRVGDPLPAATDFLAEEFLSILADQGISEDQISFAEEPAIDTNVCGEYPIYIQAGTERLASSLVIPDTAAPVVYADDIHVIVGGSVSYKKAVNAYDNVDSAEDLNMEFNRDGVDLNTEGDYPYSVTVTDTNGNAATATGTVHVLPAGSQVADIDEVNAMADEILAEILTDDMTKKEQLRAIYNWIRTNTSYSGHAQEEDYTLGAYEGFTKHAGDCFTYAAQAKFLLTRAGIDNIDVVKVVPEGSTDIPTHFWNLVNIGEGWYHLDCTPRKDGSTFFYLTDKQLEEYSSTHNGTHNFDHSLYPEIQ